MLGQKLQLVFLASIGFLSGKSAPALPAAAQRVRMQVTYQCLQHLPTQNFPVADGPTPALHASNQELDSMTARKFLNSLLLASLEQGLKANGFRLIRRFELLHTIPVGRVSPMSPNPHSLTSRHLTHAGAQDSSFVNSLGFCNMFPLTEYRDL